MPVAGHTDRFEQRYTARFKALLSEYGQFVGYELDRAALDLGLHLYDPAAQPGTLGQVRVWFQLKGIEATTLPLDRLAAAATVGVSGVRIEHLAYWFAHPEPVYFGVFLEALDGFLAADIRDLVDDHGGARWLRELERRDQKTTTLHVPLSATVEHAIKRMPRHWSMRMDGPDFRGRALGHRLDPLRCELDPLSPGDFDLLAGRLLDAHEFRAERELDPTMFGDIGTVRAYVGRLYLTYEWTSPLLTEFGYDAGSDFRIESQPFHAHGDVIVVVHSEVTAAPRLTDDTRCEIAKLEAEGVEQGLVMFNASEGNAGLLGGWRVVARPLTPMPQGLGSLGFNVLTATSIYLEFLDRISWRMANYR